MDPISIGLGVVGLGTSLFGMFGSVNNAHAEAQVSQDEIGLEQQQNDVRQQAMEASGRRNQLQVLRTSQRARSMAVQAGSTQTGSLSGSGVQGGEAETTNEGYYGLKGINDQLTFGRQLFGLDAKISTDKQQMAALKGNDATDQGITSVGNALMKIGPTVGNIFGGPSHQLGTFSNGGNDGMAPSWGNF